jgi:hypothetical protein
MYFSAIPGMDTVCPARPRGQADNRPAGAHLHPDAVRRQPLRPFGTPAHPGST